MGKEEFKQLEANILADGKIREPITVWSTIVIDGHHRFTIARKHDMSFHIEFKDFADNDAAKLWMLRNAIGKRNLTPEQMAIVRAEMLAVLKKSGDYGSGAKPKGTPALGIQKVDEELKSAKFALSPQERAVDESHSGGFKPEQPADAADVVAAETKTSRRKVFQDVEFAGDVKKLAPEAAQAVTEREVRASRAAVHELAELPPDAQVAAVEAVKSGKAKNLKAAIAKPKEESALLDGRGVAVPENLRQVATDKTLANHVQTLIKMVADIKRIGNELGGRNMRSAEIVENLNHARNKIANSIFFAVCQQCNGNGCPKCRKCGWHTKWQVEEMEAARGT